MILPQRLPGPAHKLSKYTRCIDPYGFKTPERRLGAEIGKPVGSISRVVGALYTIHMVTKSNNEIHNCLHYFSLLLLKRANPGLGSSFVPQ